MVNRPKGKLFALLAVFVAIGLITASGAFTSVQAERSMDVAVVGDASANLQLEDAGEGYVDTSGDTISIDLSGVNINADTDFGGVLTITNTLASGDVYVQIATQASQTSYTSSNLFEDDVSAVDPQFTDGTNNIEGGDSVTGGNELVISNGAAADVEMTISVDSGTTPTTFTGQIVIHASDSSLT